MSLQIIFMGTPEFSINTFNSIIKSGHKVLRVYTQPPKKKLRGQKILKSPIHLIANKHNIDVKTPNNLDNESDYTFFSNTKIDLVVVVAYGKIIPEKYFRIPNLMFLNLHASLLPKWRGAAPIQRSIINLDKETGISIMKISEKLDSGPISNVYKIKIDYNDNAQEISERLSSLAAEKILDNVDNILDDKAKFIEQDHSKASYAKKIDKSEGKISWEDEAVKILGKINGLYPVPGAFFNFKGERYKILKAEIGNGIGKAGEVISDKLEIACINNQSIKIVEIQREGKKVQRINEFILGSQIKKGSIISNV